jgi:peptidoglycan/LPS O-acetylase OafA/YrhL
LVIPCFVNAASVPVSLIFVWIVLSSRKFLHPIWISIIASISAFAGLVILAFFFSQTKTDYINILKGFPIILGLALILGLYRMKFGKINCFGCDLCDSPGYSHYMKRTLINHKDPISKEQQKK